MATVSLEVPVGREQYILDGMCKFHNYEAEADGRTKVRFIKDKLLEIMVNDAAQGWVDIEATKIHLDKDAIKTDLTAANIV